MIAALWTYIVVTALFAGALWYLGYDWYDIVLAPLWPLLPALYLLGRWLGRWTGWL